MKAISIKQPWASLIVTGIKPVENRTWKSNYRGPLLIHAAKTWDQQGADWIIENFSYLYLRGKIAKAKELRGGIIGKVKMVGCVTDHQSPWFFGPFGFVFKYPEIIDFHPCRGQLNLFEVEWPAGESLVNDPDARTLGKPKCLGLST
jgi:hypothetical protein